MPKASRLSLLGAVLITSLALPLTASADAYLADRHVAGGMNCAACHRETPLSKPVPMAQCLTCHGSYDKLADATEKLDVNPHDSHLGDVECASCHKGHQPSVLMCTQCHSFPSLPKVP